MKIGINGLAAKMGGGVTYLQHLVTNILEVSDHRLHFFVSSVAVERFNLPIESDQLTVESVDTSGTASRLWYEQTYIPRQIVRENIDLLYSPSEIPLLMCPCKQVVANQNSHLYYDIDTEESFRQQVRKRVLARALEVSQSISESMIFVTESSKRKAARELAISEDNAYAIHHGVDPSFGDASNEGLITPAEERDYILMVSTLYKHKNVHNLILAYSRLPAETRHKHPLIIIGDKTTDKEYTQRIESMAKELEVAEDVSLVGRVPLSEVKSYYSNAHLFVFPSLIESFGLPLLEAMTAEVPAVASASASLPEVGGDAVLYFDPKDPDQISVIIEQVLNDEKLREDLIVRGRNRVKEFTWEKCAEETIEIFEKAVDPNE
ncbi:glycosyltransferase family 1 protein [Natrarchaeobius halalkaliphilus]|uniref:Glycosyltransferase family 1 protein n=1 Tax=Natrarchaeobius halalkaliphilus TaxID=1679091 RepID=A0A3N6M846_9EURY|nr:glycosyltransferase family 1 protein [Natrarchaeobius halalkaliphilus]RQG91521.1 glycosyltransferase family 1 protein [Natrarchaeobius halalkaliphilus]